MTKLFLLLNIIVNKNKVKINKMQCIHSGTLIGSLGTSIL